jgi:DNA-binding transcriptional LysR family regulator
VSDGAAGNLQPVVCSGSVRLGLAYLSTWLAAEDLRSGRLEVVPLPTPAEDVPITALWPRSRDLAPKVRVVVDALVDAFTPTQLTGL